MPSFTRIKHVSEATTPTVLITYKSLTYDGKPSLGSSIYTKQHAMQIYGMPPHIQQVTTIIGIHEVHP